ncbi:MAG: nitrite/sulfite reductase [Candidatus Protistobacter heckmanni]|nr:nitrite/sulfite reductase [Candidatus Protistobacter heckmanni]
MYQYDAYDQKLLDERVAQFTDQTRRRLAEQLSEDDFRPLRLQNGLYYQRHAYMLRVAIPYGLLSSTQLRALAKVARDHDRGYGHFTTRQNIQYNWIELKDVPQILADLAKVQVHAIQTSGNCIRNITSDPFAGVSPDEVIDPRTVCEVLRQWSTNHPEFLFLPRKFKIAVTASEQDRTALAIHDVGLKLFRNAEGELRAQVWAGGGMGRTPIVASLVKEDLPWQDLLSYLEALLRVYNRHGRRDNIYKARIKILLKAIGVEEFARQVEEEFQFTKGGPATLTGAEFERVSASFVPPAYEKLADDASYREKLASDAVFARWVGRSVHDHRQPGYASITLSLKPHAGFGKGDQYSAPGDATAEQMDAVADLADRYSFGELRVSHEQNLVLADVRQKDLHALWQEARALGLATPNIGLLTDVITCPGGDFCSLANARSIPIAQAVQQRFDDLDFVHDVGEISLNISGCINACGHHHIGNIGILGVDKDGQEWYQVTLGGEQGNRAAIGKVIGPSFSAAQMPDVIANIIITYVGSRHEDELFIETVRRLGIDTFKTRVYADIMPASRATEAVEA